jgi:hypothetical protein
MAAENPTCGEERIANELKLKLSIQLSPRTVGKYLRKDGPVRTPDPKQRWLSFVRNHAKVIVACDFFMVITDASRPIGRHGRCSNSGTRCPIISTASSFTITIFPHLRIEEMLISTLNTRV